VHSQNELKNYNEELENRVTKRTHALEENFLRLKKLEKRQILSHERERIMMEMHDGMGGHLVSIMAMLEQENPQHDNMRIALKEALEDLRLVIDSLDPVGGDIGYALGMFRKRLDRTLNNTGVRLIWNVGDVPEIENLTPGVVLRILRIVQEAVTNSLKYSSGDQLTISTGTIDGQPFVSVKDNGTGMTSGPCEGRGFENMHHRAKDVCGTIVTSESDSGFEIKLLLPAINTATEI